MKYKIHLQKLGLSLFVILLIVSQARAVVLEAIPTDTNIILGEQFTLDLVISGLEQDPLDEVVRAYHLEVAFDPEIVTATSVAFGDFVSLNHPFADLFQRSDLSIPGILMLEEVSLFSDDVLASAQTDSFVLASIAFDAIGLGESRFEFLPYLDFGIDIKGRGAQILPVDVVAASIASIPEPATGVLIGFGIFLLLFQGNRRVYG